MYEQCQHEFNMQGNLCFLVVFDLSKTDSKIAKVKVRRTSHRLGDLVSGIVDFRGATQRTHHVRRNLVIEEENLALLPFGITNFMKLGINIFRII
jgi:hypothetical protein